MSEAPLALDAVTVTAMRRKSLLLSTAASVSALTGEQLEAEGVRSVIDTLGRVPGLSVETARPGYNKFTLRGVNSGGPFGWRQGAATAIYLDDIPLATRSNFWFAAPDMSLYDLERLEVLRGPQGIFFGASAIGGAVRVITPSADSKAMFGRSALELGSTSGAGGLDSAARVTLNAPIEAERIALRLSAEQSRQAGFLDAILSRTQDLLVAAEREPRLSDYNDLRRSVLRVALAYTPSDALTVTPSFHAQRTVGGGQSNGRLNVLNDATVFGFNPSFQASGEPYERLSDEFGLASLKVEQRLPWFGGSVFTSLTGHHQRTAKQRDDVVAYNGNWVELYGFDDNYDASLEPSFADFSTRVRQSTQEFRLESEGDSQARFVAGFFFNRLRQDDGILYDFRGSQQALLDAYELADTVSFDGKDRFRETQTAFFGDWTHTLTPSWALSLGARWTRYSQRLDRFSRSPAFSDFVGSGDRLSASDRKITPRLALTYQPDEGLLLYALVSEGFRTGGGNPSEIPIAGRCPNRNELPARPDQFDPDSAWNFELGFKTALLANRINLSATAFQLDWRDIQTAVLYNCSDNTTISWTGNAGRAKTRGLETEAAALLGSHWQLIGSAAYTDARFSEDSPEANIVRDTKLPFVPRVTASLGLEWNGGVVFGTWQPSVRIDHRFVSSRPDPNYGPASLGANGVDLEALNLTNLRLTLTNEHWTLAMSAQNVFDRDVVLERVAVFAPSGFIAAQPETLREEYVARPRTVGLTLERRF